MAKWAHHIDGSPLHVWPIEDLIEHDLDSDDCPCGPRTEPVPRDDGSMAWMIIHHSFRRPRTDRSMILAWRTRGYRSATCAGCTSNRPGSAGKLVGVVTIANVRLDVGSERFVGRLCDQDVTAAQELLTTLRGEAPTRRRRTMKSRVVD